MFDGLELAEVVGRAAGAHVLGELEARGVCDREFGLSTASWLAERTRGSRPVLAGRVNTAVKLRRLAVIDSAWCAGVITSDHVRVVVDAANPRVFDQFVALQAELVDAAANEPFVAWKRDVGGLAELLDADGGYDPSKDLCRNHLHVRPLGSDGVAVSGELFGEHAMSFTTLLAAATDRLWRRHHRDTEACDELPTPPRSTLAALALVDTMGHGAAADPATTSGPVVDVTLVIHADDPDRVHTPDGVTLAPDVTRHLRCDPIFHPLITNSPGETLHAGRAARHANRAQRRALTHRDGGCRFPGCDRPPNRCNAHHIIAWDHHGPTDMSNLILLCRYHHGVTHRSGWTLTAHPDHTFTWTTPNGHTLTSHPRGRPPDP